MALIADEEARGLAYRSSQLRRQAAEAARERALRGSEAERKRLRDNWEPLYGALREARNRASG